MNTTLNNSLIFSVLAASAYAGDLYETTNLEAPEASDHLHHAGHHDRPDAHAPIGVMGGHTHEKGELMFSYRYMNMRMEENYDGDSEVSDAAVLNDFIATPTDMSMQMHMFGLMYAPTDNLTLMAMTSLVDLSMNHLIGRGPLAGTSFQTNSEGIGDSSIGGLYKFYEKDHARAHFGLNLLLPTADIENEDFVPLAGQNIRLPYPMQLGHGSWGVEPSLTYTRLFDGWSLGSQVSGKVFLADNSEDYRLGNSVSASVWGARRWNDWLSTSVRLEAMSWGNIDGADSQIARVNGMGVPIIPTADPNLRGGTRIDASIGANILIPGTNARLSVEGGVPLYQKLDGPQLGVSWFFTGGIQYTF
ncbi:MAG: transporter [Luteolibacter sp.]